MRPRHLTQRLQVDGRSVPEAEFDDYALRFHADPASVALYHKGRRVTQAWNVFLELDMPADPHNVNANTAEPKG